MYTLSVELLFLGLTIQDLPLYKKIKQILLVCCVKNYIFLFTLVMSTKNENICSIPSLIKIYIFYGNFKFFFRIFRFSQFWLNFGKLEICDLITESVPYKMMQS
jgi:hypothetical protein